MTTIADRLEQLRTALRKERISYGELAELQGLAGHIDPGDVELLEAAGVPEFGRAEECTCAQWFQHADSDEGRDDGGHDHRDDGEGCTAPGCACDFTEPEPSIPGPKSGDLCSFGRPPAPPHYVTHHRCDDYADGTVVNALDGTIITPAKPDAQRGFHR